MPEFLSKLVAMLLLAVPMQLQLAVPMQLNPLNQRQQLASSRFHLLRHFQIGNWQHILHSYRKRNMLILPLPVRTLNFKAFE